MGSPTGGASGDGACTRIRTPDYRTCSSLCTTGDGNVWVKRRVAEAIFDEGGSSASRNPAACCDSSTWPSPVNGGGTELMHE